MTRREFAQLRAAGWATRTHPPLSLRRRPAVPQGDPAGGRRVYLDMAALLADCLSAPDPEWFVTDCPACVLISEPMPLAEAVDLAGAHDDRVHHGEPVTVIRPWEGDDGPERAA